MPIAGTVQFEELTPEDCLSLLNLASVGRIGISVQALPVIAPVNFVMHGADVVFRVGSGNELAAAPGGAVVAEDLALDSGARVTITEDVSEAVRGADFIDTDVWLSIGEPVDAWGKRIRLLLPYQVTFDVLTATGNPDVQFMHGLPALHDGHTEVGAQLAAQYGLKALEVTDDVFESPRSIVFDQAENRLHAIKAIMVATLGDPE